MIDVKEVTNYTLLSCKEAFPNLCPQIYIAEHITDDPLLTWQTVPILAIQPTLILSVVYLPLNHSIISINDFFLIPMLKLFKTSALASNLFPLIRINFIHSPVWNNQHWQFQKVQLLIQLYAFYNCKMKCTKKVDLPALPVSLAIQPCFLKHKHKLKITGILLVHWQKRDYNSFILQWQNLLKRNYHRFES